MGELMINTIYGIRQCRSTLVAMTLSALFCLCHGCAGNKLYVINHSLNQWSTDATIKCKPTMAFKINDPLRDISTVVDNNGSWRTLTDHVGSVDFTCELVF